ncbi:MAG: cytochrome c peroxidase [Planctomycetota bacterium]|jgi:cytochrome c peroxidase
MQSFRIALFTLLPLMVVALVLSCTPEEIIAVRDSNNPGDPNIAMRPVNSIVSSRLHGSNFRQKDIESGFSSNGHAQSWDGRLFIGRTNSNGIGGWYIHLLRPEKIERDSDGAPNFKVSPSSGTQGAFSPRNNNDALLLKVDDRAAVGLDGPHLNALAIVPHPNPANTSLIGNPNFEYDIHQNPFPTDGAGNYQANGSFETYELLIYATKYNANGSLQKTVSMDVQIVVANPRTANADVHSHQIVRNAEELKDIFGSPILGIEPTATFDGRLIVQQFNGLMRYTFNEDPTALSGWSVPKSVVDMHHVDRETMVAGEQFQVRYPIASRELKDHLGVPYSQGEFVNGAYPWISLDGTEIAHTATTTGSGSGRALRGGFTVNGVATRFQAMHVDGPINDTRDALANGDQQVLFVSSPGTLPGFWFPFIDDLNQNDLPMPYSTVKPVIPFFQSNRRQYFEVPVEDALDGRYLTVLRMTEGIDRNKKYIVNITPDTSGNLTHGDLQSGSAFPLEAGLPDQNLDAGLGRSVIFGGGGHIRIKDNASFNRIKREFSAEMFFMKRAPLVSERFVPLCGRLGAFQLWLTAAGELFGEVQVTDGETTVKHYSLLQLNALPLNAYVHFAMTAKINDDNLLSIKLYQNGDLLGAPAVKQLGQGDFRLVENSQAILVGPVGANNLADNSISMDDFKLSYIERDAQHIKESAYQRGIVDSSVDISLVPAIEITLGQSLFADPLLSGDGKTSCATCHDPSNFFTDGLVAPDNGTLRNTPTLINRIHTTKQFHDGRTGSLEEQAILPILNPIEMNNTEANLLRVLNKVYATDFLSVYGSAPTTELMSRAIANFCRTITAPTTAFDNLLAGNSSALNDSEKRGMQLFHNKARCSACHNGANFSDELFHNTGFINLLTVPKLDVGRAGGRFKTPTLRAIKHTGPYMHDGSRSSLEEVIDVYNNGGIGTAGGADIEIKKLGLTAAEKADLVNFLKIL